MENGDDVVAIVVSGALSGTCQSANIAAADYPGRVFVVDSRNIAIGLAILTEYTLSLVDAGKSAAEIVELLNRQRERVRLMAVVDTLEYLQRGGRLSKTAAIAGGILSIKPIIALVDGEIKVLAKGRGVKQAVSLLNQEIAKAGRDKTMPALLGYTGTSAEQLHKYRQENEELWPHEVPESIVCGVVGTHAGPGAVAVAFFS